MQINWKEITFLLAVKNILLLATLILNVDCFLGIYIVHYVHLDFKLFTFTFEFKTY